MGSFGNSSALLASWRANGTAEPCQGWQGVTCDGSGSVTGLALSAQGLSGRPLDTTLLTCVQGLTRLSACRQQLKPADAGYAH